MRSKNNQQCQQFLISSACFGPCEEFGVRWCLKPIGWCHQTKEEKLDSNLFPFSDVTQGEMINGGNAFLMFGSDI